MLAFQQKMGDAMLMAAGRSKKEIAHVDMAVRMAELKLDHVFPEATWPAHNAVRELATKVKQAKKGREASVSAFPFMDLKRWV